MSTPPQTCIYIPTHLIHHFRINPDTHEIDTSYILNTTTAKELCEIITAVRPRIHLAAPADEDHEFVKKVFKAMVASELVHLGILETSGTQYIRAPFRYPLDEPEDSLTTYTAADVIDGDRQREFKVHCIFHLRGGRYRIAGDFVSKFVGKYTYLNQDELNEIKIAKGELEEHSADNLTQLQATHKIIQACKLQLRQFNLSRRDREVIQAQADGAQAMIEDQEQVLGLSVRDVGFLSALLEYHTSVAC